MKTEDYFPNGRKVGKEHYGYRGGRCKDCQHGKPNTRCTRGKKPAN